jgi:hypothetical protein
VDNLLVKIILLQLRKVRLEDVSEAAAAGFAESLERRPLVFSMEQGEVGQLCASPQEPLWVLNMKRGVLSTFQQRISAFSSRSPDNAF